ncbi:MAG: 4Fe-4S dicluster domain-containing protein [Deltaproteobacteria bacterium]|jgi:2-oxoglutarate ferredoxin oxidoreductase subunit delta|nr:4Fe-4S dicluster domain-containing protein [Deltaproteobacteria bacterium]
MPHVEICAETCKGCALCVRACPKKILRLSPTVLNQKGYSPSECTDPSACTACRSCALTCPDVAITVYKD